jgi:predicted DNA-binding protein
MKRFTMSIPEELKKDLEKLSKQSGRSQAEVARSGIWNEVKEYKEG